MESFDGGRHSLEMSRYFHFNCTTAWDKLRINKDVLGNSKAVVQVSLHFIENVLGGTSEKDGACFGFLTFSQESEVLVSDEFDLKETTFFSNVRLLNFFRSINNGRTCYS